jgi:hypothetical protein
MAIVGCQFLWWSSSTGRHPLVGLGGEGRMRACVFGSAIIRWWGGFFLQFGLSAGVHVR